MTVNRGRHNGILAGVDRNTGELKTIDRVVSGKPCNCKCPNCGTPLVAKKGQWVTHHFAHESLPEDIRSCQETALHETAKIIAAHLTNYLSVPERRQEYQSSEMMITQSGLYRTHTDVVTIIPSALKRLSGRTEPIVPEISPYRPDARVETPSGEVFVEIHVTNPVSLEKAQAMQSADIAVLEIDFSKVPRSGLSLGDLIRLVEQEAPRKWISNGLKRQVVKARNSLDASIRETERERQTRMFSELRKSPMAHLVSPHIVSSFHHVFSDRRVALTGRVPFDNLREEKGFWLADLPGSPGALVTSMTDKGLMNRLFAWYKSTKSKSLTVMSVGEISTIYASDGQVIDNLVSSILEARTDLPERIPSLKIIERFRSYYLSKKLSAPITPGKIKAMGSRVFIDDDVPQDYVTELILSGYVDIVIVKSSVGWEAFASAETANRFERLQPSGGLKEHILYHVRYSDPCLVRFVPAPAERLQGDMFSRLELHDGDLFFRDTHLGLVQVHYSRGDFWHNGGLLLLPDPMRKGAYHLEPSREFSEKLD